MDNTNAALDSTTAVPGSQEAGRPATPVATATPSPESPAASTPGPAAAAAHSVDKIGEMVQTLASPDTQTIREAINKDPDLYKEILEMSDEQLDSVFRELEEKKKSATGTTETPAAPASPGAPSSETIPTPQGQDEAEEVIKLKPSILGTYYSKGRTLQEAILELVNGKKKSDEIIEYTKLKRIPAMEKMGQTLAAENLRLKKELEDALKKSGSSSPAPAAAAGTAPAVIPAQGEIPELPNIDDVDFFDPEQKAEYVEKLKARDEFFKNRIEAAKKPAPTSPVTPGSEQPGTQPQVDTNAVYDQYRLFIEDPENKPFFGMKKDVAIVERNFINFVDTLAKLHNLPTTYDAQGRFTPEAQTLLDKYLYDNNPNNPVRTLAQQANIAIDEDTPALLRLYLVANHQRSRKKVNQSTGADELISLNEAFTWARTQNPEYFKVQEYRQEPASGPKAAAVSPDAIERGIQSRKQFAPEPKNILSEPNIGDVGQAEFLRLLSKPTGTYTAQEEEFVRKALKTYANFSDEEVGNFFKLPQHP